MTRSDHSAARLTYGGWLTVLALSMAPAVSNGMARFAYGLILPSMRTDLGWSYTEAGWVNTVNAIGYLLGALLTLRFINHFGPRRLFVVGMAILPISLFASGMSEGLIWQSAARIAAGLAGAPVFIAGSALVSALFPHDRRRNALAIAVYFGGGGLGMAATGLTLPGLLADRSELWPMSWYLMGGLSAIVAIPAIFLVKRAPGAETGSTFAPSLLPLVRMVPVLAGYFLYAVGYIVYLTFLIAWMRESGADTSDVVRVWTMIGLCVVAAPFLWRGILARSRRGEALALACAATGMATILPVLSGSLVSLHFSAIVFGLSVFMGPTAVASFARVNLGPRDWGKAVALFTVVFAAGQILGPVFAGALSDRFDNLAVGLATAGIVQLLGAGAALMQRRLDS